MVTLRKPTTREFSDLVKLSYENFVSALASSSGESETSLKEKMGGPPEHQGENNLWFLIVSGQAALEQKMGFVWIHLMPDEKSAFGYDIFLEPKFRSQGIGREVMQACSEKLMSLGIHSVEICVFEENQIARALYASLGFTVKNFDSARKQFRLALELKSDP
jgi:ribosomal protein S18 acetylase RimI-like enzyme